MQHGWSHEGYEYGLNLRNLNNVICREAWQTGRKNGAVYICKRNK